MASLRTKIARLYGLLLAAGVVGLAAVVAAPFLMARGSKAAAYIYAVFAPLCHQRPERCFFLAGFPLAVCARCTGIYLGAFLGLIARPFLRPLTDLRPPRAAAFLAASLPIAVDAAGSILGVWRSPGLLRFLTGLLWGPILPFYLLAGLSSLFASGAEKK
jgi:uncharacterized membrane protein